jgi:hypothetical protein
VSSWIEVLVALNEDVLACEGRFSRQCTRLVERAAEGQNTTEDEWLLASYGVSLALMRECRDQVLNDAGTLG